ncbi:hypothetical protein CKO31_03795 [Thiohalocapsa halophila]|uniref:TMEM205-like domain-containing protein n=1 Tax=Thiohalocapsa halophila TaxID=69359 RepID=A0ABS1CDJ5_9GAMM|nr:DUF4149 domain-containing protein [Thiohalocapsa halophila]MBK1629877.1 hypothetical protein [Thiohalocapsa halophila]
MNLSLGFHVIAGFALALAFGGMTFFSAVMAPLVFTKLPFETAGGFIRQVFPWYYLTIGGVSVVAALALLFAGESLGALLAALVAVGFWLARQVLMPRINAARDAGEDATFNRLHRVSVVINGAQWLLLAAALVMVLV